MQAKPPNKSQRGRFSYSPPKRPATKFPEKHIKNQHPIVSDKNCFGASFDTSESPIGDRQSSDSVITKYPAASQSGEILHSIDRYPAKDNIAYAKVINKRAIPNFSTEEGS